MRSARLIAWHHFKFHIPADWETTAYSVEDRVGRLEFSTRHGLRSVLSWEPCRRAPDCETMMVSFLRHRVPGARPGRRLSVADLTTQTVGPFLLGYHGEPFPCQAMCYLPQARKLLTWVLTSSEPARIHGELVPILSSFEPNDGATREYAFFGLHFILPSDFQLEDMTTLPANVMTAFESRAKSRVTFRRWGLPEVVLDGEPLGTFYERILRVQGCTVVDSNPCRVEGMEAVRVAFHQRGQYQMDKFMGRLWRNGQARVWHNRDEKRIYAFESISPPRARRLEIQEALPQLTFE